MTLQDGSVNVRPDNSPSLGRGLRCGFLGMLHLEVVQQRLLEEHGVDVLVTAPTVPLRATLKDGSVVPVRSADALRCALIPTPILTLALSRCSPPTRCRRHTNSSSCASRW